MSIDGSVAVSFQMNDRRSVGISSSQVNIPQNAAPSITFANGVAANQANQLWGSTSAFSGTTASFNLVGNTLTDSYGTGINSARVKTLFFYNQSTNNNLVIGNAPSNAMASFLNATGTITLPPGAFLLAGTPDATGWVTNATAGTILLTGTSGQPYQAAFAVGNT